MTTKVVAIVVLGREFFDRRHGSTYQSAEIVKIFADGAKETLTLSREYGYGSHYLTSVCDLLFGEEYRGILWQACQKNNITLIQNLETVSAWKKLHQ